MKPITDQSRPGLTTTTIRPVDLQDAEIGQPILMVEEGEVEGVPVDREKREKQETRAESSNFEYLDFDSKS